MPNAPHELLHHVFRSDTRLVFRTLRMMEIPFPSVRSVSVGNCDATEIRPLGRSMDTLLMAETEAGPYLVVVEVQNKPEKLKLRNWAYYPTYLHERHACPVVLIVVCRNARTAKWAQEPYRIGLPGSPCITSTPLVIGPHNMPQVTTREAVLDDITFALLSALAHANEPGIGVILEAIAAAIADGMDLEQSRNLMESLDRGLEGTPAHDIWEKKVASFPVTLERRSRFALENQAIGKAEGKALGEAEAILRILDRRGVQVSEDIRARILGCTDLDQLGAWLDDAITATSVADLTGLGD